MSAGSVKRARAASAGQPVGIARTLLLTLVASCGTGCHYSRPMLEPYGKTFYLDGAGGWGYGAVDVPEGLRRGGYVGDCEVFDWSTTRIPLIDQVDPLGVNKIQGRELAKLIKRYKQRFPKQEVNIVALSAGTGVAVWALEELGGEYHINNLFLLGSSLASKYDLRQALRSVAGRVYVYYSPHDLVLGFVKAIGTVDGQLYVPVAGLVGMQGPGTEGGKVVNIGWDPKWERLGWKGGHTDYVNRNFVQYEIAQKLIEQHPQPIVQGLSSFPRGRSSRRAPTR